MLIDWFTVGAQTLNFLVLVWLMKRFLYKPVLDAIDAREKRMADQIAGAAAKVTQAEANQAAFQGQRDAFDRERDDLLAKARADAQTQAKQIMEEARRDADALTAQRQLALAAQTKQVGEALADRATKEVFAISKKALSDLASQDLEAHIVAAFVGRLRALSGAAKTLMVEAVKADADAPTVRSAFALRPAQSESVQAAFNEAFQATAPLHFEVLSDPLCGVELCVGGQKLAWSINQYVSDLQTQASQLLDPSSSAQGLT